MNRYEMSAIDAYLNRAYKIIIVLPLTGATTSAFVFTIFRIIGWWPDIPVGALVIYDIVNLIYVLVAIYLLKTCTNEEETIKPSKMLQGKIYVGVLLVAQWNCISYLVPYREWWAYLFFFIALSIVFFDIKFTSILTALLLISMAISWVVHGEYLFLSLNDEFFYPTLVLRLFCIGLTIITLLCITYFGGKYLVEELERHANYDTLTHLLNRRSMEKHITEAIAKAAAGGPVFCIMMLDIDDFKHVNDSYGNDCGDEVLRNIAHIVSTGVKKDDFVFRFGGEEILVLFNIDMDKAKAAAERIRNDIARDPIVYKGEVNVKVTATIGISEYKSGASLNSMVEDADAKLYYGKRNGKNQVVSELNF